MTGKFVYINPNISILKKMIIGSTAVLCLAVVLIAVFNSRGKEAIATPAQEVVSSSAPKEKVDTLPKETWELVTPNAHLSFVMSISSDRFSRVEDRSTASRAYLRIRDSAGQPAMEFVRVGSAESLANEISTRVAIVGRDSVIVGGVPFELQRVLPFEGDGMRVRVVPLASCERASGCIAFTAMLYSADNSADYQTFLSLLKSLVFLPKPSGWKVHHIPLLPTSWNIEMYYPDSVEFHGDVFSGYSLNYKGNRIGFITLHTEYRTPAPGVSQEELVLPIRKEIVRHNVDAEGNPYDLLMLAYPEGNGAVEITGNGEVFQAMVRTITFVH